MAVKQTQKDKTRYRETLLVIVLGFALLSLTRIGRDWMLYVSLGAGILGMLSIHLNRWIHKAWFFLGEKMGFVVSKVVLGALFLVVLLPMGLLSRLIRKDIMHLRPPGAGYHVRNHVYEAGDMEDMW